MKDYENKNLIDTITEALLEKKAENITVIDLRELTSLTDFFIICDASVDTQIRAITSNVIDKMREENGERVWKKEGLESSKWVVLDYVHIVVHIMDKESREYYNIEGMWNDAEFTYITEA